MVKAQNWNSQLSVVPVFKPQDYRLLARQRHQPRWPPNSRLIVNGASVMAHSDAPAATRVTIRDEQPSRSQLIVLRFGVKLLALYLHAFVSR